MLPNIVFIGGWGYPAPSGLLTDLDTDILYLSPHELCLRNSASGLSRYAAGLQQVLLDAESECVLVGWSMGAMIALELITSDPTLVARAVLFSATPSFVSRGSFSSGVDRELIVGMRDSIAAGDKKAIKRFFSEVRYPARLSVGERDDLVASALDIGLNELVEGLDYLIDFDIRERLQDIATRLSLIHGEQDALVPFDAGRVIQQLVPGTVLLGIEQAGHEIDSSLINELINEELLAVRRGW